MSEQRPKTPPKIERSGDEGESTETHPSFGMVSLSRWTSGGGRSFFGSAVEPHAGVSLTIRRGEKKRSLSNDWYHGTDEIIEINMTEAQFAQLITSFNIGSGVPCTISSVNRRGLDGIPDGTVPECPEISEHKRVEAKFKVRMMEMARQIEALVNKAEEFQGKPNINKADRKAYADIASHIKSIIASGVPFIQGQFNEALDMSVSHAKADVDAFMTNLLRQAGMEALRDKMMGFKVNLLPEPDAEVKALPVQTSS